MIQDKEHCQKIKDFINMSNSMIFGAHLENMQIGRTRRNFLAYQHCFLDSAYQVTPYQGFEPFSSKMPTF